MTTGIPGKKAFILLLVIILLWVPLNSAAAAKSSTVKPISLVVNGKEIKPAVAPVIKNNRLYVEFRSVVQALGITFSYNESTKVITATSEDAAFKIDLKTGAVFLDGKRYQGFEGVPVLFSKGANTLVVGILFDATKFYMFRL